MRELVNIVRDVRTKILAGENAKKMADDFEQKAKNALIKWLRDEPGRSIAYKIFSFEIKAIALSDFTVLLMENSVIGWNEWPTLNSVEQLVYPSENQHVKIVLTECEGYISIKELKPFLKELNGRDYRVLFNTEENSLWVSFEMPKE